MKLSKCICIVFTALLLVTHLELRGQIILSCITNKANGSVSISYRYTGGTPANSIKAVWGTAPGIYIGSYIVNGDPGNFDIPSGTIDGTKNQYYFQLTALDVLGNVLATSTESTNILADPIMDSVTVVSSGFVSLTWERTTLPNVSGYDIFRWSDKDPLWAQIASVSSNTTSFTDVKSDGLNIVYKYAIKNVDYCNNLSPGNQTEKYPLNNIVLDIPAQIDPCTHSVMLTWNDYLNMPGGIDGYKIYRTDEGGSRQLIATLSPTITMYTDTHNFISGKYYRYQVTAYNKIKNISSSSGSIEIPYNGPNDPDSAIALNAGIENDKDVFMRFYLGPSGTTTNIRIERSPAMNPATFVVIDSMTSIAGGLAIPYLDMKADVHTQSYLYRIRITNACGAVLNTSDTIKTILLQLNSSEKNTFSFSWNAPMAYKGIKEYQVFRSINGVPGAAPIKTITNPQTLQAEDTYIGSVCDTVGYYIVAIQNDYSNPPIIKVPILSNTIYPVQDPVIFPNAFRPGSMIPGNSTFKPVAPCPNTIQSFEMLVFNKWGEQIFKTTSADIGWDGKFAGQFSQTDVYTYLARYSTSAGKGYTKRGTVTLLR